MASDSPNLRLVRRCVQWKPKGEIDLVLPGIRGIYALLHERPKLRKFDVVYIGMAEGKGGIRRRLRTHANSRRKGGLWTHFSFFEVWPNITQAEIAELEGLFREIYRKDRRANRLNRQKKSRAIQKVRVRNWTDWEQESRT